MSLSKHVDKRAIPLASMIDPDIRKIWVALTQKGKEDSQGHLLVLTYLKS